MLGMKRPVLTAPEGKRRPYVEGVSQGLFPWGPPQRVPGPPARVRKLPAFIGKAFYARVLLRRTSRTVLPFLKEAVTPQCCRAANRAHHSTFTFLKKPKYFPNLLYLKRIKD